MNFGCYVILNGNHIIRYPITEMTRRRNFLNWKNYWQNYFLIEIPLYTFSYPLRQIALKRFLSSLLFVCMYVCLLVKKNDSKKTIACKFINLCTLLVHDKRQTLFIFNKICWMITKISLELEHFKPKNYAWLDNRHSRWKCETKDNFTTWYLCW